MLEAKIKPVICNKNNEEVLPIICNKKPSGLDAIKREQKITVIRVLLDNKYQL